MSLAITRRHVLRFYAAIFLINSMLVMVTALSDLRFPYTDRFAVRQLDLKLEANLAVWYSSLQLALNAVLAAFVALRTENRRSLYVLLWFALAAAFLILSADETASVHDRVGRYFSNSVARVPNLSTQPNTEGFGWVPALTPAIAGFIAVVWLAVRPWRTIETEPSRKLMLLGLACWIGVLCAELFEGYQRHQGMPRGLQGAVEEGFEVWGATFMLIALVEFHARCRGSIETSYGSPMAKHTAQPQETKPLRQAAN